MPIAIGKRISSPPNPVGGVIAAISAGAVNRALALAGNAIGVVSLLLAALFLIPFKPDLPAAGLDSSWAQALNVAVERGLVFGRDIVFTFGPLASLYTRLYSPATDRLMLAGSALFAGGLCAGVALALTPRRLVWAVALPLLIAMQKVIHDGAFLAAPFFLVLAIARTQLAPDDKFYLRPTRLVQAGIAWLAVAVGMLPVIKGSFAGVAGAAYVLALAMLAWRGHWRAAGALLLLGALTPSLAWITAGQPLGALPRYFIAQAPIISGYTQAMSARGPAIIPRLACGVSLVIVIWFYFAFGRGRGLIGAGATLGLTLILFIAFKAAMVRQDMHVLIFTGSLLLVALAVTARSAKLPALLIWILVLAAWFRINDMVPPKGLYRDVGYLVRTTWGDTINGLETRLLHPGALPAAFANAEANIRAHEPVPPLKGSVDIYPTEQSAIFANHLAWNGRPVFQSYSAYTPGLDRLNADHLERAGADTIFFSLAPIDNRLAPLDDAGSLIPLLGHYTAVARTDGYVQFARHAGPATAAIDPSASFTGAARLGERVAVPDDGRPLWATVNLELTPLGKLVSALYKPPQLSIELALDNGQVQRRRFMAAIGRSGFVLSPFLNQTQDVLALAGGVASAPRVVAFKISVDASRRWQKLWQDTYAVQFKPVRITPDPAARALLMTEPGILTASPR
ncbi:MAG: hypothetical protein LBH10_01510 [Burkholderiaceae bacterium]|jgi:hypothetical protein|nr:hypothetical protein [Burkholderiaceae bacterium]